MESNATACMKKVHRMQNIEAWSGRRDEWNFSRATKRAYPCERLFVWDWKWVGWRQRDRPPYNTEMHQSDRKRRVCSWVCTMCVCVCDVLLVARTEKFIESDENNPTQHSILLHITAYILHLNILRFCIVFHRPLAVIYRIRSRFGFHFDRYIRRKWDP